MLGRLRSLSRVLKSRRDFEQGMTEELRFHIEQYTDDLVRSGVPPREAARRARIEFGSLNSVQEECREARGLRPFDELLGNCATLPDCCARRPRFTATALVTLAVCLGANLTIFAVVDAILLRPLPFPEAGRLVTIFNTYPKAGVDRDGSSIANYYERRGRIPAFAGVAIYSYGTAVVGEAGSTEREQIARVSPDFFATLGTGPSMGRSFTEEETSPANRQGRDSHRRLLAAAFRCRSAGDRQARFAWTDVGTPVVGVLPPGFRFLSSEARLYFPFSSRPGDRASVERHSGGNSKHMIARLKPGATLAQAQAQIDAQNATLEAEDPAGQNDGRGRLSFRGGAPSCGPRSNRPPRPVVDAGGRVRPVADRRGQPDEPAVDPGEQPFEGNRCPAGIGREPVARGQRGDRRDHFAHAGRRPARARGRGRRNPPAERVGGRSLAFGESHRDRLSVGVRRGSRSRRPGTRARRAHRLVQLARPLAGAIQSETRGGTASRAAQSLRHGFIVAQIALATVLLSGAGLLGLSLERAMAVSPGFRPDHVLTGQISLPWNRYPELAGSPGIQREAVEGPRAPAGSFGRRQWSTMCP